MRFGINYGAQGNKLGFGTMAPGAVINDYVNALVVSGKRDLGHFVGGSEPGIIVVTFEVAAADSDGSIYRVVKNIHPDIILTNIKLWTDAITSGTSYSLGLYQTLAEGGAIIGTGDQFLSAKDISAGNLHASPIDGMTAVDIANIGNKIFEHAGHTILTKKRGYDLAVTATTVGSAAGTVSLQIDYVV